MRIAQIGINIDEIIQALKNERAIVDRQIAKIERQQERKARAIERAK